MRPSLALWLPACLVALSHAQNTKPQPGSIAVVGDTKVSAMMMFLGNEQKVYIIDKVEGNPTTINGHPAWAAEWDIASKQAKVMDMRTNAFCAAGSHLPNGSYLVFGGNGAIGPGGNIGSQKNPDQVSGLFDTVYQDHDGAKSIRRIDPCTDGSCGYFDDDSIQMAVKRWYPGAEPLADGTVVLVGGFVNGGYVNRNFPNTDPLKSGGAAEPTYEFYPPRGDPVIMKFMVTTSGLNAYAHMFLMPSSKMFVQANLSTILWDYNTNTEIPLPDMPGNNVRVYPASGAAAMLPLTPGNNYTPTLIFCGGNSEMQPDDYGNYANPRANPWEKNASQDCQRITPEPTDGSQVNYVKDDNMLEGRTMGQFIILPDQTLLMVNGGGKGTAGYATQTGLVPSLGLMPFGMSLATDPVLKPAIYDPNKPAGQRWSNDGLAESKVPRLYHSSALLLPDGSVLVAGSNPNVDYNASTTYPTEYRAEYFYPPYFSASVRPAPKGIPGTLSYGGDPFDIGLDPQSFSGSANEAAGNTTVVLVRPGWTTHGMNMGQRLLQLNNTFTVADDGHITLHVAQPPPNPNLLQPGPVLFFVVVHGIPSVGKMTIVGNGQIGPQPTGAASVLPQSILSSKNAAGSASSSSNGSDNKSGPSTGVIVAATVAGVAVIAIAGVFAGVIIASRRRRAAVTRDTIIGGIVRSASAGRAYRDAKGGSVSSDPAQGVGYNDYHPRGPGGSGDAFIPLQQYSHADLHAASNEWTPSQRSLHYGSASPPPPAGAYAAAAAAQPTGGYPQGGYAGGQAPVAGGGGGGGGGYYSTQAYSQSQEFNPYDQRQGQGQGQGQGHPRYL